MWIRDVGLVWKGGDRRVAIIGWIWLWTVCMAHVITALISLPAFRERLF